ncbi:hypothetical protein B296_00041681 [Ensete ventricosum]|uniref:Uncharacterized protein n=1 Tax=Ensete ventricosum TaxID=4639 RepID=A0A426Z020_ENSVE|nr:hypothetical protein B296_00041681 [Ensete ventricosum]
MSQERSTPGNPEEDVPPAMQPTSGVALQLPLPLPLFGDGNMPSHTLGRGNASSNYPLHPTARPVAKLTAPGSLPPPSRDNTVTRRTAFGDPTCRQVASVPSESDQAPSGDAARCLTSTPNASVHSLSDPDTFSSDSTDSLRAQLCLINQRIDDVHKTIRMKYERGESPLCGSPFIQEIQDTPIPQHVRLSMLEAYDGGSDPMEHIATFQA